MLDDRNRASHTYNERTAEEIYERLPGYAAAITTLIARLRTAVA